MLVDTSRLGLSGNDESFRFQLGPADEFSVSVHSSFTAEVPGGSIWLVVHLQSLSQDGV